MENIKVNYVKKILSLNKVENGTMLNDKFFKRLSFIHKMGWSIDNNNKPNYEKIINFKCSKKPFSQWY